MRYVYLSKSWTTFNPDGSIKDLGLRTIKHKESYAEWNDNRNDWDYVIVPCNCEICQDIVNSKKWTDHTIRPTTVVAIINMKPSRPAKYRGLFLCPNPWILLIFWVKIIGSVQSSIIIYFQNNPPYLYVFWSFGLIGRKARPHTVWAVQNTGQSRPFDQFEMLTPC